MTGCLFLQIRHKISLARFSDYIQSSRKRLIYHDWKVDTTGDDVEVCWEDLDPAKWAGNVTLIPTLADVYRPGLRRVCGGDIDCAMYPNSCCRVS